MNVMINDEKHIAKILRNYFLFENLDEQTLAELSKSCSTKEIVKNEILFQQGSLASAFYIVIYGKISIFRLRPNGDEQTIHIHSDGDIVAEAAIFDQINYPASCKALKESKLIRITKDAFCNLILKNPEIAFKILGAYSRRLRSFVSMVENLSLDDVKQRLLQYLEKNSYNDGKNKLVNLTISKKELSNILGMSPETLSRALKALKEQQIISEDENNSIVILKNLPR